MLEAYRLSARQRAPRRRHNGSAGAPAPVAAAGSGAGGSVASAAGHTGAAGSQASAGAAAPAGSDGQVGVGDLAHPVQGPAPSDAAKVGGAAFSLVKNWDFGSDGTVRNIDQLSAEFQYHDHWNTIANGNNYGSVIVAPNAATAIGASGLGLPSDMQPVEDPARPYREFTASSIKTYVRPLSSSAASVSVSAHNTGCGSLTAKWQLANGGALLKHDVLWETRARMPVPVAAYWFALWTAGTQWDRGAEMDVLESFGTPNIHVDAFHSDSVGGSNIIDYASWPNGLTAAGVPTSDRALTQWHTWTWIYLRDDTYKVYYDGYMVQHGTLHWTLGGTANGQPIDMHFLMDLSWGHTQIADVNITLPASAFPLTYEIDYSRVYMR
jgi:hypothetical protein